MKSITFCCDHLKFMWDNHLLERREEFDFYRLPDNTDIVVGVTKGFRVRRSYMYLKRDTVLYECPYCKKELVFADEVFIPNIDFHFKPQLINLGICADTSSFKIPMSVMKQALFVTKRRCKQWPPKD